MNGLTQRRFVQHLWQWGRDVPFSFSTLHSPSYRFFFFFFFFLLCLILIYRRGEERRGAVCVFVFVPSSKCHVCTAMQCTSATPVSCLFPISRRLCWATIRPKPYHQAGNTPKTVKTENSMQNQEQKQKQN